MESTWGQSGADRTQVGPMLAPWTLLFGYINTMAAITVTLTLSDSAATQITKTLGSTSIRYRSDAKVSDRCLIDVDPMISYVWACYWQYRINGSLASAGKISTTCGMSTPINDRRCKYSILLHNNSAHTDFIYPDLQALQARAALDYYT